MQSSEIQNSSNPKANPAGSILDMVVQLFLVMMAVVRAKEPPIAGRATIRVLKKHKVT
jgi:hypothetical protein